MSSGQCPFNTFISPLILHCYSFSHEINILSLATGTPVKHRQSAHALTLQLRAPDGNRLARLAIASERTSISLKLFRHYTPQRCQGLYRLRQSTIGTSYGGVALQWRRLCGCVHEGAMARPWTPWRERAVLFGHKLQ